LLIVTDSIHDSATDYQNDVFAREIRVWRNNLMLRCGRGLSGFVLGNAAVLGVPGVVIPGETNYLLAPPHPEFRRTKISKPQRFEIGLRLIEP
jgi:RES domain-containing protein